ncbi:hypothetical protein B296_00025876 [Ensete ventricosum]|uniref:Uncharacterized protein n=1 Tax=Ensete ventricosum TaxID=4639 RepID=A0A426X9Q5_ENSVE|nr:hypothetical protein B296_00025876 [Ensete ventricosum]
MANARRRSLVLFDRWARRTHPERAHTHLVRPRKEDGRFQLVLRVPLRRTCPLHPMAYSLGNTLLDSTIQFTRVEISET